MPIYEYGCDKCGLEFEELVFGDQVPACPACGSAHTRKMISRPTRHVAGGCGKSAKGGSGGGCAGCSGGSCSTCGH